MAKLRLLTRISDILEYGSQDEQYEFQIKGHSLNDDDAIVFINSELFDEGENLEVKKIIKKEEIAYTTARFFEGQDAKDEGFKYWIDFFSFKDYKKGHGKCTNYIVELQRCIDE
jgi:hypothetical protein